MHKPDRSDSHPRQPAAPWRAWLACAAIALVVFVAFRLYTGICLEDALITYRYAENIARGQGFAFNPGERVLGTTTPLCTVILAGFGRLLGPERIPLISNILMMAATLGAGLLTGVAVRRGGASRLVVLVAPALVFFHRDTVWTAAGGMETPLVLLLMAASLAAVLYERDLLVAVLCGLLVMTRIDGVFWCAAVFLPILLRRGWRTPLYGAVALVTFLPWAAFAWWYFHSVIPQSVLAKQAIAFRYPLFSLSSLGAFLAWFARPLGLGVPPVRGVLLLAFLPGVVLVTLGTFRALRLRPPGPLNYVPPVFLALFALGLYAGQAPRNFPWYLVPATWAALVVGLCGTDELRERLARWCPEPWPARFAAMALATILALQAVMVAGAFTFHRRFQANENAVRRAVGVWLDEHAAPDAVAAMEAIGYQGTYAHRRILDVAGLISPGVTALYRESATYAEGFRKVLQVFRPDYLVLRAFEVKENRLHYGGKLFAGEAQRRAFEAAYRPAARFTAPYPALWGENAEVVIYARTPDDPAPEREDAAPAL